MNGVCVSAPGKAFLIGEYAVLDGVPALVTAVDVRAVAHRTSEGRPALSAVVRCAHARVGQYLEARGVTSIGDPPVVETGGFTMGSRKLGLGLGAVAGLEHGEAFCLEASTQQSPDLGLIVDDEDGVGHGGKARGNDGAYLYQPGAGRPLSHHVTQSHKRSIRRIRRSGFLLVDFL